MNENTTNTVNENNPEPDWGLMMFWEDITAIFQKIFVFIVSIFKAV